ncbi:LysE family translocator [Aquabacter sp. CN5-332]|uniref:LysE family translocator n=1 Tax=Aquabacter sp. CN5-332 TaxID=3156608 RepID=UPI0032B31459
MSDRLAALFLFAFVAAISPGPNNLISASSGARFGFLRTVPQMLGVAFGFPVMILAMGLGLGGLFDLVPGLHTVLKLAGAAYLLYLAWSLIRASAPSAGPDQSRPPGFLQSVAFQWVNPKAWTVALSVIPAFTHSGTDMLPQVLVIAAAFVVTTLPSLAIWAIFGVAMSRVLQDDLQRQRLNVILATLVAASVVLLLL